MSRSSPDFDRLHARRAAARERVHRLHGCGDDSPSMQLTYGIGVTVVGVLLTLASFGLADTGAVLRLWPIALIIGGGAGALRARDGHGRIWGGFWVILGIWLLGRTTGRLHLNFWDLVWPVALVGLGVKLWRDAIREPRTPPAPRPVLGASASRLTAILAGTARVVQEPAFPGASMTTVLGNCTLDFRHSGAPVGGEAVIEVFALLGAHDIVVPDGWTVVVDITSIGAHVDDQRGSFASRTAIPGDTRPRVVIRGTLVLSGVTIKQ